MTRASDTARLIGAGATINDGTTITVDDNSDNLTLTSTDADANAGPNLRMYRNSASPADVDRLGHITFDGRNDNSQDFTAAQIQVFTEDASDGTEDSSVTFTCINGGSVNNAIQINPTETTFNESSVDRDFRVESNGNANMLFVNAGDDRIGIGTASPSEILHLDSSGSTTTIQIDSDTESSITFNDHGGSAKQYKIGTNITDNNSQFEIRDVSSSSKRFMISSAGVHAFYLSSSDNNYVMNVNPQGSVATGLWNAYYKADSAVFTGYHYYAKKDTTETFSMGDVVVLENGKATKCTTAHATNVVGIISGHPMGTGRWLSNDKDVYATEETAVEVASVGDSQDWNKIVTHYLTGFKVCNENGAIASGDLLCSANKTGYLMKQDGTAITTETVGKSMDDVTFESDGTANGIYGFLYCG